MHLEKGTFGVFPVHMMQGLKAHEQSVLAWLWFYANQETRRCWPSQATLAKMAGMGTSKLNTTLNDLEEKGLVTRKRRTTGKGGRMSTLYYVPLQRGHTTVPVEEEPTPQDGDEPKEDNQKEDKFSLKVYLDKWHEITGGTLPAAHCAAGLKKAEGVIGREKLLAALEAYIHDTDKRYLSIHKFISTVGMWVPTDATQTGKSLVVTEDDLY